MSTDLILKHFRMCCGNMLDGQDWYVAGCLRLSLVWEQKEQCFLPALSVDKTLHHLVFLSGYPRSSESYLSPFHFHISFYFLIFFHLHISFHFLILHYYIETTEEFRTRTPLDFSKVDRRGRLKHQLWTKMCLPSLLVIRLTKTDPNIRCKPGQ